MRVLTSCVYKNEILLFGRTSEGPTTVRRPCRPHLILGSLPSDLSQRLVRYGATRRHAKCPKLNVEYVVENAESLKIETLSGQDITAYCERSERPFYRVSLPDVYTWYNLRRMLREPVELGYGGSSSSEFSRRPVHLTTEMYQCPARVYDDHVNPAMQYLIENDVAVCGPGPAFTALSYDLECNLRTVNGELVFPDSRVDPIITIGAVTDTRKAVFCLGYTPSHPDMEVYWFETESDMLESFNEFVRAVDPDFILGHNVNRFDNVYYRDRCRVHGVKWWWSRLPNYESSIREVTTTSNQRGTQVVFRLDCPGRVVLDTYEKFRADHNLRNYKLNTLGEHFLQQQKVDLPYAQIPLKFRTPEGRLELAVYCVQDANLVLRLVRSQCKILNVAAMSNVTGVCPDDILNRGQGIRTITLMLRYALRSVPRLFIPRGSEGEPFEGAVVLPPLRGKYDDVVLCVDFASLYPSIMRAMNMSYETLVSNETIAEMGWVEGVDVRTVPDYVDGPKLRIVHNPSNCSFVTTSVREGLLPKILREVLSARSATKALMREAEGSMRAVLNGKQLALKVVANSIYGFTGASKGFLPETRIASSVTKYGRGLTLRTKDFVNNHPNWKSEVIYGDSVSGDTPVFVRLPSGVLNFVPVRDLGARWCSSRGKQFSPCPYEVWTDGGWTSVKCVIRHRTSKPMFRVFSRHGTVDVTSDHSLLLSDGTPVTVDDLDERSELLHAPLPHPTVEVDSRRYEDGYELGVGFMTDRRFPDVLSAPEDVLHGFYAGAVSMMGEGRICASKLTLAKFEYVCCRLGVTCCFRPKGDKIRLSVLETPEVQRLRVVELGGTDDYVYDLTTSNHHFHAGLGSLIVHNTDSCFIRVPPSLCPPNDLKRAHEVGEMMASEITKIFLKPVLMEYESAFKPPFLLLKKKRYIGNLCLPGKEPKTYIKGCECVRRDFAPIVKKTQLSVIDLLLKNDVGGAKSLISGVFDDLYAGKIPLPDLTLSRKLTQLPEMYKSKMPHVELAKRLTGVDKPVAGDRVEFLIRTGHEDLNQRAITPSEVEKYVVDYRYYAEKQLSKPLQRIMELVTDENLFRERQVTAPMTEAGIVRFFQRKPKKRRMR